MTAKRDTRGGLGWFVATGALALMCAFTASACARHAAAARAPAAQPAPAAGVPVTLDGDVLFHVYNGLGALTPADRAEAIEKRLVRIAEDPFYSRAEIAVAEKDGSAQIFYRGTLVGIINRDEAAKIGPGTPVEVATSLAGRIAPAIERYRERRQPLAVGRATLRAVLATLLLVVSLLALARLHRWSKRRIEASGEIDRVPGVLTAMFRFLALPASFPPRALRLARAVLTVLLAAVYLLTIFDLFPLTRGYVAAIVNYVLDPLRVITAEFWDNIGNFFFIVVVAVLARFFLKVLLRLMSEAASGRIALPGVEADSAMLVYKALRIVVVAISAMMIYPYVPGSDSAAFKGIGLFAGALLTLGASSAAGNMIGGVTLTFSRMFRIGDRVKIGEVTGDVVEMTLLITRIQSLQNEIVTVPNGAIMSGHVINYTALARTIGLLLTTEVTIGYDAPWRQVHALLVEAALRTPNIVADPAPFVLQKSLNDYHVSYVLWAYTRDAAAMIFTYGQLHQNIQDAFNEGGIEILSPAFSSLRDGNTTTIPAAYDAESRRPRRFAVEIAPTAERAASDAPSVRAAGTAGEKVQR